jgi:hypothetical protein
VIDVRVLDVRPHPGQAVNNPGCWAVQFRASHAGKSRTFWRWHTVPEKTKEQPSADEILARFWDDTFEELHGLCFQNDQSLARGRRTSLVAGVTR